MKALNAITGVDAFSAIMGVAVIVLIHIVSCTVGNKSFWTTGELADRHCCALCCRDRRLTDAHPSMLAGVPVLWFLAAALGFP
uniref:Uncharacterized protein n=1 Tax=Ixodes ricinus TaxID=34613 RepID=A0A6B0TZP3_IXORI